MAKKTEYSYLVLNLIFKMGMGSVMKAEKTTGSFFSWEVQTYWGITVPELTQEDK